MLKRLDDMVASGVTLVLLTPVFVGLALFVWWRIGKPVFFVQSRPGKDGTPFPIVKFRTMREAWDAEGNLLPDAERMTGLGRFLRATSLDELPELWNVLKGDMSLVGPRPLLMEYLPLYTREQARRHEVRPGITGWAQVNGRNAITWEKKFELDVWYVDHQSFCLDMKILWLTLWQVVRRDGIRHEGHETMPAFAGTTREEDPSPPPLSP